MYEGGSEVQARYKPDKPLIHGLGGTRIEHGANTLPGSFSRPHVLLGHVTALTVAEVVFQMSSIGKECSCRKVRTSSSASSGLFLMSRASKGHPRILR